MKINYGDLDPVHTAAVSGAWNAASESLNSNSVDFPAAESNFKDGFNFALADDAQDPGRSLYEQVLALHKEWNDTVNMPDSAARVLGMLAALEVRTNHAQGGNA